MSDVGTRQRYVPVIVGQLQAEKVGFLAEEWLEAQAVSSVPVKACVPGPYTIMQSLASGSRDY